MTRNIGGYLARPKTKLHTITNAQNAATKVMQDMTLVLLTGVTFLKKTPLFIVINAERYYPVLQ